MSQGRTRIAGLGGLGAAVLASLCCVGPVLAASIGVGSLGFATAFEPLRPLFICITFVALGFGFFQAYKRQPTCKDDACKPPNTRKGIRAIMWVSTVLAILLLGFPYYSGSVLGIDTTQAQDSFPNQVVQGHTKTCTMRVTGMTCAGCEHHVRSALEALDGVENAKANSKEGSATVRYNPNEVEPDTFAQIVAEKTGYETSHCMLKNN